MDGELVLDAARRWAVHEVDALVQIRIRDTRVGGDVRPPPSRVVPEEVVRTEREHVTPDGRDRVGPIEADEIRGDAVTVRGDKHYAVIAKPDVDAAERVEAHLARQLPAVLDEEPVRGLLRCEGGSGLGRID